MEKVVLKNGKSLLSACRNKNHYRRAYNLVKNGCSPEQAYEMSKGDIEYRIERNQDVMLDIYYNTLCRINDEIRQEIDPEIRMARVEKMITEAITGMNVVGYTNRLNGGLK